MRPAHFTETTFLEDLPEKTEIPGKNGICEKTRLSIKPGIVVTRTNTECELSSCVREMAATWQHRRASLSELGKLGSLSKMRPLSLPHEGGEGILVNVKVLSKDGRDKLVSLSRMWPVKGREK